MNSNNLFIKFTIAWLILGTLIFISCIIACIWIDNLPVETIFWVGVAFPLAGLWGDSTSRAEIRRIKEDN